ncbi:RNA ligase-domain-containing protein [Lentinula aciculospora]|uniref:tRNA ligase n=1 Tax=Lentinula aciculospora TaxID=153920 RepID=A0A9W8ZTU1_9AGAR|nr:RNA ligase-domain-containing protein [Lentinula aciculospora]KAJ4467064.1 RNA ligase-domain-containing protein [Lentinula aciculospora]
MSKAYGDPHPATRSEDSDLINDLLKLSNKNPKLVKSTVYDAPADPTLGVRSWKMNEHKYYDVPSPFPTLARGLFTTQVGKDPNIHRIIARGYDKFFNIGEVPWTAWPSLKIHTAAPYTLSLKSNGCIIFIGALTPEKLIITSKHSIGPVGQSEKSHAQAGEDWLRRYLQEKGRTEADLAKTLWDKNWTAIAELCDDSFEEHVLGYPPHLTGLHLHGLNTCTKEFNTLPHSNIDEFAAEWGFIKTESIVFNSIEEVQNFTSEVSKSQQWNGQAVEGFVVRTHVTVPPPGKETDRGKTPYAPGSTFFFKVKFDEPYLMYRDWREVTKTVLSAHKKGSRIAKTLENTIPRNKMKRPETRAYARWVIGEILRDPASFKDYTKGKGIIATRERFLKWLESEKGKDISFAEDEIDAADIGKEIEQKGQSKPQFGKTVIVPVAIPGCGKTTVAVALTHIFGFGHTQSDDVHVKKSAPVFLKNVQGLLKTHDVVIADKNNHLRQHRTQLRELTQRMTPPVRLLALNWSLASYPRSTVHRICGDRVLARGDNHQTLRADTSKSRAHEDVVRMFIAQTEELVPAEVDVIVDMDLEADFLSAVNRAVDGICKELELPKPSPEKIAQGIEKATGYRPATKKDDDSKQKQKEKDPRYFGILPEINLERELSKVFGETSTSYTMWMHLKQNKRISQRPHITVIHKNSLPGEIELWERCMDLHMSENPPMFEFKLKNVVWNDRVMAVVISDFRVVSESDLEQKGTEFADKLAEEVRTRLHITVGTQNHNIQAVEAKSLVEEWRRGKTDGVQVMEISEDVLVRGRIKGLTG